MKKLTVLSVLTLAAAACGSEAPETEAASTVGGTTLTVAAENLAAVLPVPGTVVARRRAALSTRMMAHVSSISVEVGDVVRAGQTLLRLGTDDIAVNRVKAQAAVAAATAARDEAARHAARMDTLYAQDAVARVQRDQARLQLRQVESQLATAEAALQEVESANRYAVIRAPFAGAVVSRHIHEGDLAAPGMPLLEIEATGPREAVFAVPADIAEHVAVGDRVTVTAGADLTADAEVRAVASGADPRTRTVEVRATLPGDWPTGVALTALVSAGARTGVVVPERAIVRRGQLTGVRVMTPAGELIRWVRLGRRVTPLATGDDTVEERVEVLSGLEPGERIVL
jgi:RND family efflux transporter MFP subunit